MSEKLLKKAINKHKAQQFSEAQSLYRKILKTNPDHIDANYMLGTLYAERGDSQSALKYMKTAESLAPQSQYIKNNLGNVYRMLGEYDLAVQCYESALSIQPDMAQALNNLAIVQRRLQRDDSAVELYKSAIRCAPEFVEAHYNLGKIYLDKLEIENAFACFNRVLEIKPDHALARHELGTCYMKQGDKQNAIHCFEKYLDLAGRDDCGARLKLSFLNAGEMPDRQPESLIVQTYEKKARTWDQDVQRSDIAFMGPHHIQQAAKQLLPDARGLKILDIGCGTGLCGAFLKPLSSTLDGVDLSSHMLNFARQKTIYDNLYCKDVVHYMNNSVNSYDLITGSGVLIFFGDLYPVLSAAQNALVKNGSAIFTLYRNEDAPVTIRDNLHFAHSAGYIRETVTRSGLQLISLDDVIHEFENNIPQPGYVVCLKKSA